MGKPTILLTNDDGWDAPGLDIIKIYLSEVADVAVLAPAVPHSYCGHRVTTDAGMELVGTGGQSYRLNGTPADCVRVALRQVFADRPIDWVISGINRGGNLGADIYTSGTVAAAREAALLGVPALAISQYTRRELSLDWEISVRQAAAALETVMARGCDRKTYWNLNLPHLPEREVATQIVDCEPDNEPLDVRFRLEDGHLHYAGSYQARARTAGRDIDLCFNGAITVSKLRL